MLLRVRLPGSVDLSGLRRRLTLAFRTEFRSGKASDIVSTLVSIYESRDVIVKELQILLAQKLLAVKDYDLEKEVRLPWRCPSW